MSKRVLVVGCNGLLGQKLVHALKKKSGWQVLGASVEPNLLFRTSVPYKKLDITQADEVYHLIADFKPHAILNAAAYTNVDRAEIEKELCWAINVVGVENLASAAKEVGAGIFHVSTDYVFSGDDGPYTEADEPAPRGFYARSKLAAEWVLEAFGVPAFVARTSTLFGLGENIRPNFVTWLIAALRNGKLVTIVDDQVSNPTLADSLAHVLVTAVEKGATGVYHVTGSEALDRHSFALRIAEIFGLNTEHIRRGKTADLNQLAPRPMNAALIVDKVQKELGVHLLTVDEALTNLKNQMDDAKK